MVVVLPVSNRTRTRDGLGQSEKAMLEKQVKMSSISCV
jgi:hypothetical protein